MHLIQSDLSSLHSIINRFHQQSIVVVGDLMVDEYLRGSVSRISQEGPVMVLEVRSEESRPGGAANVANNLQTLGAHVSVAGVVGDDEAGRLLISELTEKSMDVSAIVLDPDRPTTRKTRVVAQNQQVLRIDREKVQPVSQEITCRLLGNIEALLSDANALLISDYRKGTLTAELAQELCLLAKSLGKPLITNPKPSSARWLRGARVLSLNQSEAEALRQDHLPDSDDALRDYGERLRHDLGVETLLITRGSRGLCLWLQSGQHFRVPAHIVEVADVAGAGDTTISTMAMALACGATDYEAAMLANMAGGCVVRKLGVATLTSDELRQQFDAAP